MSVEDPKELFKKWSVEDLSADMALGQILQHIILLYEADQAAGVSRTEIRQSIEENNQKLTTLQTDVNHVMRHTGLKPRRGRRKGQSSKKKGGD